MGRKRSVSESSGHEYDNSEEYAGSSHSNHESPTRKKVKRKHKKSHNYIMIESEFNESEYYGKHKHKHKKHKRESSRHKGEHIDETYNKHLKKKHGHRSSRHESNKHKKYSDSDRSRHSSHSRKDKHRHSKDLSNQEEEHEVQQEPKSRWADDDDHETNLLRPIKTEPVSDDDTLMREINNSENHKNDRKDDKHQNNERENWGRDIPVKVKEEQQSESKEKVNMGLSGKLTEDTNTYNGVVIKYSQPPEARKPKRRWRWYIFKGDEELPFLPLHRQSAYLIGRERKVADIPTDHPSCSKQHAVFQYRLVSYERRDGSTGRTVKPYILDLESANGTYVNNRRIDPRCYVELLEKDVVKFGYSSREYVLLHEASKGSDDDLPDAGTAADGPDLSPISLLRSH